MDWMGLFRRAVVSGCVCSIFYHVLLLLTGAAVTVPQAVVFTVVFILLYFVWLVMVTWGRRKK